MKDLLLEIGTEEIPSRFMPDIMRQLEERSRSLFSEERLSFESLQVLGTPRRLALLVRGLAGRQEDLNREVKGPSRKAAFDEQGSPTKAVLGFCRGQEIDPSALVLKDLDGTEYVFARVSEEGRSASEVIPDLLQRLVWSLGFPKNMRWGSLEQTFVRPIRWLVALHGSDVMDLELAGVRAGRTSRGHRFLGSGSVEIGSPGEYENLMEESFVVVDPHRRRRMISEQLDELAAGESGVRDDDPDLLEEVVWLVEYPTAFVGSLEPDFLELPREAIITPMKLQQKYFPLSGPDGSLLPRFMGVRNGDKNGLDTVVRGNQKVLSARLEDARFFYTEDLKVPLSRMTEKLDRVVFQEKLGTFGEKVKRIGGLAVFLAGKLGLEEHRDSVAACAAVCKGDLTSQMVYEFPELQGIMGEYYARAQGLGEAVARGIREHYMPRFAGDSLPESPEGICVAIADKMDSIAGIMGAGMKPTGSQDPYALRRAAQGIVSMAVARELNLDFGVLVEEAVRLYGDRISAGVTGDIREFFLQRMRNILEEAGFTYDQVDAVVESGSLNFHDTMLRARALRELSLEGRFGELVTGVTRAANLSRKSPGVLFRKELLREPAEEGLHGALDTAEKKVRELLPDQRYLEVLQVVSGLRPEIDRYLEEIMVMVDDEALRNNRLALLDRVVNLVRPVADLSRIVSRSDS